MPSMGQALESTLRIDNGRFCPWRIYDLLYFEKYRINRRAFLSAYH